MTVRELINILEDYGDDTRVVFLPVNSDYYVEDMSSHAVPSEKKVSSFCDNSFNALVIRSAGKCGSI